MSEEMIRELQGICPGMPADQAWLLIAAYELWTRDKLRAVGRVFEVGALDAHASGVVGWL